MGKSAKRVTEQFRECSWRNKGEYARIVGRELASASVADLEEILQAVNREIADARGSEDSPCAENPYKLNYFEGIAALVESFMEAREELPACEAALDTNRVSV